MNLKVRITSVAYAVPPDVENVETILERERARVETTLAPLDPEARQRAIEGLGLSRVRVCGKKQPYDLILEAARSAITQADVSSRNIDLIIDYSTFPGETSSDLSVSHKLSTDLGAESSINLSFKAGGCGALHIAIKTALGWMACDENIKTALLVCGDTPPVGNRSLLPVTVQGDAASAVVLSSQGADGPMLLGVETMTLSHLHRAIALTQTRGQVEIKADPVMIEHKVMPIYYLNFFRLIQKILAASSLKLSDIDHFIYSNISHRDREGFRKMVGLAEGCMPATPMSDYGHTFASDLVINYVEMRRAGLIHSGQLLLFASAGVGFTWGVTLARA